MEGNLWNFIDSFSMDLKLSNFMPLISSWWQSFQICEVDLLLNRSLHFLEDALSIENLVFTL